MGFVEIGKNLVLCFNRDMTYYLLLWLRSIVMNMSVCVCLSARISPEPHARSLPNYLCILPTAVAQSSSNRVTKFQGEGAVLEVFFPIDNALYSIVSETHTNTAEPMEMPFGTISGIGLRTIPKGKGKGQF